MLNTLLFLQCCIGSTFVTSANYYGLIEAHVHKDVKQITAPVKSDHQNHS